MKTTLDLVFKSDLDKPIKLQIPETVGSINKVYAAYIVSKNTQILFENK